MNYLAIIQARSSSTRLPGKVLKEIEGKTELEWVAQRVSNSKLVDKVVVATTTMPEDEAIENECKRIGVDCYRGSLDDVLDRFYKAAKQYDPEYTIRITADCPCFDPELLDAAIESMNESTDYLGMLSETFPDGLDLEIIKFSALEQAWKEARLASEREHLTQYLIKNPEIFTLQDFVCELGDLGFERWTVDEPEDLELILNIFKHFIENGNEDFSYAEVHQFLNDNPSLREINAAFSRNEGLAKSLREDHIFEPGEDDVR